MNILIHYMITNGVPRETIVLLLLLPIVVTIIAFARQVIGIKGFGIYTPLIISFAFLTTGLRYGITIFAIILIVGTFMRFVARRFRLLYLPRIAIVLIGVSLAILLMFLEGAHSGRIGLIHVSVFAILIMITLVEKFIAAQIERGAKKAVILTIETLFLSVVCFWVISWMWLQNIVFLFPLAIIIGCILINILLGKWTGLRVSEYFRFREVIKSIELPEEKKKKKTKSE